MPEMLKLDDYEQLRGRGAEVWASMANARAGFDLSALQEEALTFWFANAMQIAKETALKAGAERLRYLASSCPPDELEQELNALARSFEQ